MKYFTILIALTLIACGVKQGSELSDVKSELPDNYAIKSLCYGLSQDLDKAVKVEADDESDIRLCAVVQKDGHLGLDMRYQPERKIISAPVFAMVTLQDGKGRTASEMFRMSSNPLSGGYELYLTDGCLVGTFGGCTQSAEKKMFQFLDILNARERSSSFDVSLAFVSIKNERETQWDLHNPLKKENYKFAIKDL
ncbi:MAG: hypothetical protein H7318_04385 [Oligoflexus sp.]|nr:hypothetical protein [Oligoflexus sp.]